MKNDRTGTAADVRADLRVGLVWKNDLVFDVGPAGRAPCTLDGKSKAGHSPPEALLNSLVACVSVDVVLILQKMRMPAASVSCDVTAERQPESPRRITKVHLHYQIAGEGIVEDRAMRAIELSVTKHCTVRDTLDPEIPVTWSLELSDGVRGSRDAAREGEPG